MNQEAAMFSSAKEKIDEVRKKYLTSTEGALSHSLSWLTADLIDVIYPNPRFKVAEDVDQGLEKGIPLYFIHGTCDRISAFSHVAKAILSSLPTEVSALHLVGFEGRFRGKSIKEYAIQFKEMVKANNHTHIMISTHSRGCLVGGYFWEYLAEDAGITVLFNFSAAGPYKGSKLACSPIAWFSQSVMEMQPDSQFLKDFHRHRDPSHLYPCVGAELDFIVTPESACIDPKNFKCLKLHGHLSMLGSEEFADYLLEWIFKAISDLYPHCKKHPENKLPPTDNEYEFLPKPLAPMWDLYYEITLQLEDLKARYHLQNPAEKIEVIERFQDMVLEMIAGNQISNFRNTNNMGEFIEAYLHATGNKLDTQLNYPLSLFFSNTKPQSQEFMEKLRDTYRYLSLPAPLSSSTRADKPCLG
jgi:hypothetical protein